MAIPLQRSQAVISSHASQPQITAPVLEYRCMFTHDVHKKQKKWHDGTLRFHAFNKRVMVYDDARNFVGDLHYRLAEEIGEGLELRLERPVLVQVEEQLGQSNTDLTPLLNRQKQDENAASTVSQPTRATISRINAANPQIKPKSIRELLGASQGRIGRARIPIQSPYEQRVALAEIQPIEPPAKRRKVQGDSESTTVPNIELARPKQRDRSIDDIVELSLEKEDNRPLVEKPKRRTGTMNGQAPVLAPMHGNAVLQDTMTDTQPRKKPTKSKSSSKKSKSIMNKSEQNQHPLDSAASVPEASPRIDHVVAEKVMRAPTRRPRSSLKFSTRAPRPKLMYRALVTGTSSVEVTSRITSRDDVEQSFANTPKPEDSTRTDRPQVSGTSINDSFLASPMVDTIEDGTGIQSVSPLRNVHGSDGDRSQAESAAPKEDAPLEVTRPSSTVNGHLDTTLITDSPLFMPRTDPQTSPLPVTQFMLDDLMIPQLSQANGQLELPLQSHNQEFKPLQSQQAQQDNAIDGSTYSSEDLFHAYSIDDPATTEVLDEGRLQSTTDKLELTPTRPSPVTKCLTPKIPVSISRPFRRIVSDTLPSTDNDMTAIFDDFDDDDNDDNDDNDSTGQASPFSKQTNDKTFENGQTRKYTPLASLRQTTSDSVALEAMIAAQDAEESDNSSRSAAPKQNRLDVADDTSNARSVLEVNQESNAAAREEEAFKDTGTGAWTSTEAFLLFDWWPPGREKPDYGQPQPHSVNADVDWTRGRAGVNTVRPRLAQNAGSAMANKKYGTFGSAKLVSQRS